MQLSGARTKREVVDIALRRLIEQGDLYRALLRLKGKLAWRGDVRARRSGRTFNGVENPHVGRLTALLSPDRDFERVARHTPLKLWRPA
ncbi:MAG: type II toxin-antitoxin system VapB family antitoxin [Acidobacteria bacterium]|nr:type II toxin-antitoxin system VapB family antitoxin [Acidobacteriota bacterium]